MAVHLESDLLRTFVAIADHENFTRAAVAVGRTQSAVSMQMKRLEDTVGSPLFERGPRGVALTRKGNDLIANARQIVDLIDKTAASIAGPELEGQVRIGIPEEYAAPVLSRTLRTFGKSHPGVEILVIHAWSTAQKQAIERGELDIAVVFEWEDKPQGEILMADPTVWATSEVYRMHEDRPLPIALYEGDNWCSDFANKSMERSGHDYTVAYRSNTSGGLTLAVSAGLAIAPLSRSSIPPGCRELTEADGFGQVDWSNVVMYLRYNAPGRAIAAMADAIRDSFRVQAKING